MNALPVSRRQVLRAGAALLTLPWLASLAPAADPLQQSGPPQRLVLICHAFGLYGPSFFPAQAGHDYAPSEYLEVLGDLRDQCTVFSGISHHEVGGDHASEACFLTGAKHPTAGGFRNSISLDWQAATHVGAATRIPLLVLGTDDAFPLTHTASGAGVPGFSRPSQIFARLFLNGSKEEVAGEVARLKRGQSILDRMGQRFAALKGRLGAHDLQQLADYSEAVRDMERQLHADEAWTLKPKPAAPGPGPADVNDRSDVIGRSAARMKLARLALMSDSTRVVSLFIRGQDLKPPLPGVNEDHHGVSHHGRNQAKIDQLRIIEKAQMAAFRDFLLALRGTNETGGTLLDRTQVLIGSNLGDASGHGTSNLPILLAGGGWKHGSHLAGRTDDNTPLGRLFVSMLQRFGVRTTTFGSASGTIDGLA